MPLKKSVKHSSSAISSTNLSTDLSSIQANNFSSNPSTLPSTHPSTHPSTLPSTNLSNIQPNNLSNNPSTHPSTHPSTPPSTMPKAKTSKSVGTSSKNSSKLKKPKTVTRVKKSPQAMGYTDLSKGDFEVGCRTVGIQAEPQLTRREANEKLRLKDEKLNSLISEIESEKFRAQSDFKFSVFQIETRLKIEKLNEIRRLKEEKFKEIQDLSASHYQQLLAFEQEHEQSKTRLTEQISQQKIELVKIKEELERTQKQYDSVSNELRLAKGTIAELQINKCELETDIKERKEREKNQKHEEGSIIDLRKRVRVLKELNEIVLGEYRLLEKSRNDLIANWHLSGNVQPELLIPTNKAPEFGKKLDQILNRRR